MTTNPLTAARTRVAEALTTVTVPVHDQPPGSSPTSPCVVLYPGDPWIRPTGHVTLNIVCYANPAGGNGAALDRLEAVILEVWQALSADGLAAGEVSAPRPESQTGVISASMPITLRVAPSAKTLRP